MVNMVLETHNSATIAKQFIKCDALHICRMLQTLQRIYRRIASYITAHFPHSQRAWTWGHMQCNRSQYKGILHPNHALAANIMGTLQVAFIDPHPTQKIMQWQIHH